PLLDGEQAGAVRLGRRAEDRSRLGQRPARHRGHGAVPGVHRSQGHPLQVARLPMLRTLQRTRPGDGDKTALFVKGGPRGVLCLHGFTGTPFEVRPLAEALAGRGYTVVAPVLAGHCGTIDELACTGWPDWLASANDALDELLRTATGPVAVAGFSLGGLLSLRLARTRPADVAALAIVAAPLRLRPYQVNAVRALCRLPALLRRGPLAVLPKFGGYDVTDTEMKRRNPGLSGMPIAGINSLIELGEVV